MLDSLPRKALGLVHQCINTRQRSGRRLEIFKLKFCGNLNFEVMLYAHVVGTYHVMQ